MTKGYRQLALQETLPGMILSDDLLDTQGHVLLSQGTILTAPMLHSLQRHAIEMLPILYGDISPADEAAEMAQRRQRLTQLFRKTTDNEGGRLLRKYVHHFRLGEQT